MLTAFQTILVCSLGGIILFLTGFVLGSRRGLRLAKRKVAAWTILHLRQKALQTGTCPTCDGRFTEVIKYAKKE